MLQVDRCEPIHKKSKLLLQKLRSGKFGPGGLKEEIRPFIVRHDTRPIHTIFCLDDSGSMGSEWPSVQEAVKAFFQIRRELGSADDRFSCVQFSDTTHCAYKVVGFDAALLTRLKLRGGGTSFAKALSALEELVKNSPANLEVVIVFMTDGQSEDKPDIAKFQRETAFGSFYGIAFKNDVDHSSFEVMVKTLNGQMKRAKDVAQLRQEFCHIAQNPVASHSK
jgi:hypothetical protein